MCLGLKVPRRLPFVLATFVKSFFAKIQKVPKMSRFFPSHVTLVKSKILGRFEVPPSFLNLNDKYPALIKWKSE